ncbi:MAG: CoB--CoM heterodisulfide reductase iron-sulfur subunit A family protein [Bacteroidales bacterium]|nr:CoB--CoM heterodisulfide reductase iron-sulfur subunit A family protein [Bacteroidales bacterium]
MDDIRIGVYICWCGTNIAKMVDVEAIAKDVEKLPNVAISRNYKYMCSDPGQDMIIKDIKECNLNRVIVAACSPRIHEFTFRKVLVKADINPYYFEMANIREHVSWVHNDREEATKKAKALVYAAVHRVAFHEALNKRSVSVEPATLIIGGGISGMNAAVEIADAGRDVYLVEKTGKLGGMVSHIDLSYPFMTQVDDMLNPLIARVQDHPHIELFLESEIKHIFGYIGNFEATVYSKNNKETNLIFGNVVIATGLKPFDPGSIEEYGYGKFPDVITSLEFEEILKGGEITTKEGKEPKHVAIIHCVGSRNQKYHEYCSHTCCMTALKYANQIKSELPDSNIYEIYSDMRVFGKGCEELYTKSSRKNIKFFMFDQENGLPKIINGSKYNHCDLLVELDEKMAGRKIGIPVDMAILMVGMEAQENARDIAHAAGISMCSNNFYMEKHPKLDPVATTTDGVFIVGTCQGPKDIPESVAQSRAAAARILASISQGNVEIETTTAEISEKICCGCQTCVKVCPYTAIKYDPENNVSVVNEVLCKGCGTCGSACPTGAVKTKHFTDEQILAQIRGMLYSG